MIKIKDVSKNYALGKTTVQALRGVTLTIRKGEFVSIAGPSGSGKTTLLNMIGCLDKPSEGSISIHEIEVSKLTDHETTLIRREKIGFIFQTFNLIPVLNAAENIELPLLLLDMPSEKRQQKIQDWLHKVGLADYGHHRPDELSGGQRQRVSIARALIAEPALILADEPTANLDQETGHDILSLMQRMNAELNTTFIFSTHDPKVMEMAKRRIDLVDGQIASDHSET